MSGVPVGGLVESPIGRLHVLAGLEDLEVQGPDPLGDDEPGLELVEVERLGQVVVDAGPERGEDVDPIAPGRQQDEVGVGDLRVGPHLLAELDPAQARHLPVADHDVRAVGQQVTPGLVPVGDQPRSRARSCAAAHEAARSRARRRPRRGRASS